MGDWKVLLLGTSEINSYRTSKMNHIVSYKMV